MTIRINRTFTEKKPPYRSWMESEEVKAPDARMCISKAYAKIGKTFDPFATGGGRPGDLRDIVGMSKKVFSDQLRYAGQVSVMIRGKDAVCNITAQAVEV